MPDPIRFYFDFASPYGYFASARIDELASRHGRAVEWRPILMWAVLKAHDIAAPMESAVKRDYMLGDMERSAAFFDLPYRRPAKLPLSSHLAARLYYAVRSDDPDRAASLAWRLFEAFFVDQRDISDADTLVAIGASAGVAEDTAREGMSGTNGRAQLEAAVAEAVSAGVVGSPHFILDGEGFFGADRLPQLAWRLSLLDKG